MGTTHRIIRAIAGAVLVVTILACGGSGNPLLDPNKGWFADNIANVTAKPGGTVKVLVQVNGNDPDVGDTYKVTMSPTVPTGWTATVTPENVTVSKLNPKTAEVAITVPANATPGSYPCSVKFESGAPFEVKTFDVVLGAADLTTAIEKITDFEPGPDGTWVSKFRVVNGPPLDLVGSLQFTAFNPNMSYWYRPDNTLDMHVNESQEFEIVAAITDSAKAVGANTFTAAFNKAGTAYQYQSTVNVPANADRNYSIFGDDAIINNTLDKDIEAKYRVTVDLPVGSAGNYTLTVAGLDATLSATITPSTPAAINANGDPVDFEVKINRVADDAKRKFKPYEFVVVGTHDSIPAAGFRQVVMINTSP